MAWFNNKDWSAHPLARAALLKGLTASELGIVQSFMHERQYLPHEVIFDQGEEGQALYFLLSGRVLICHHGKSSQPIAELQDGNFFGELGLLDNWPRSAQAIAASETQLAVLFRGDFERLMEAHARIASKIALQLACFLGQRLRGMVARQEAESSLA
jgi:CRP-like cAMP-binding protein